MSSRWAAAALAVTLAALLLAACGSGSPSEFSDGTPRWSPDGRMIAFTRRHSGPDVDVYVMRRDGSRVRLLARHAYGPAWSPDGQEIAFDRIGPSEIWTVGVDDGSLRRVTENSVDDQHPTWSADGSKLALSRGYVGYYIFAVDVAAKTVQRLTRGPHAYHSWPDWSPDGRRIVFVNSNRRRLALVDADGANQRAIELPDVIGEPVAPRWSPDGRVILFGSLSPKGNHASEIYTIRPDGTGLRRLTRNAVWDGAPDWSPDGRSIVFARDRGDGLDRIYVMDRRGRNVRQLTSAPLA